MDKIGLRDLKNHLKSMTMDELITDITTLHKDIPAVQEYYFSKLSPDAENVLLVKYKRIIEDEFFPARGFGKIRASVVRQAINDFKKVAKLPISVVDLLFFHVSVGVDFTDQYGDINEAFYERLEKSFEEALKTSVKHGIFDEIKDTAKELHQKCQGYGWGFSDNIDDIYFSYCEELDDEET